MPRQPHGGVRDRPDPGAHRGGQGDPLRVRAEGRDEVRVRAPEAGHPGCGPA